MEVRAQLLADDVLRPIFRARAWLLTLALVVATIIAFAGGPILMAPLMAVAALLAWWQRKSRHLISAWAVDTIIAIALAAISPTPLGLTFIVGWGAVIGLVDTRRNWVFPLVSGAAAALSMALIEPAGFDWTVRPVMRAFSVAVIVFFFLTMFRRVGEALRHNERELRAFFERVPVALTRTAHDGRLLDFNQATSGLLENPTIGENVVGRYVDPASRREFVAALERDGVIQHYETTLRTSESETIDAIVAANAVTDEHGSLKYIETAILDATPMRHLEAEREMLAQVIDSATDLVAVANLDGSIRYANPAARSWARRYLTDDDAIHAANVFSAEDFGRVMEALRLDRAWSGTLNVPGREGQRILDATFQVLEMAGEQVIAAVGRDVTDEVETQRKLEDLVRAKDELVASISHEIRTPLSVVLGLASELRDRHDDFDGATHDELAALIAEQGQEMENIVEDLLVAARADAGSIILDLVVVDLRKETETTLRSIADSERPEVLVNNVTGTCMGDPSRVRQILRNLIINAFRYGGDQVRLASYSAGGRVSLEVVDNGSGVPPESVIAIFEPFARAHSEESQPASIGLGLSVSRDLANRMSGDLTYTRRAGETVFTLTLPGSAGGFG